MANPYAQPPIENVDTRDVPVFAEFPPPTLDAMTMLLGCWLFLGQLMCEVSPHIRVIQLAENKYRIEGLSLGLLARLRLEQTAS